MDALQKLLPPAKTYRIRNTSKDVGELALELGDGLVQRIEELTAESLITWVQKNVPKIGAFVRSATELDRGPVLT